MPAANTNSPQTDPVGDEPEKPGVIYRTVTVRFTDEEFQRLSKDCRRIATDKAKFMRMMARLGMKRIEALPDDMTVSQILALAND